MFKGNLKAKIISFTFKTVTPCILATLFKLKSTVTNFPSNSLHKITNFLSTSFVFFISSLSFV